MNRSILDAERALLRGDFLAALGIGGPSLQGLPIEEGNEPLFALSFPLLGMRSGLRRFGGNPP
jgi:hypothetical protein